MDIDLLPYPWIIFCRRSAKERRCYNVTSPLIGWAHAQNDPCTYIISIVYLCVDSPPIFIQNRWMCLRMHECMKAFFGSMFAYFLEKFNVSLSMLPQYLCQIALLLYFSTKIKERPCSDSATKKNAINMLMCKKLNPNTYVLLPLLLTEIGWEHGTVNWLHLWPILLTWFNINFSMDKQLRP